MIIKLIVKNINFFIKLIHLKMNNVYIINTNITNKNKYIYFFSIQYEVPILNKTKILIYKKNNNKNKHDTFTDVVARSE